ncbi:hypothetical protein [Streptomyces albireticuli]|uniref:Uncharacterized protein n=1 Tax=Streptomyces albireticuli TaxID=1940 RepID=A0A2A2D1T1_9ACTN|nr:hypothetical protein [Streptomyces albireticuli]MCD9143432.1 hypothetical protein [Streptomyces albireticuli]MCD9164791.1 hypothetical protein [Streptomyces albireticuli]MCD9191549.1 hypothetical protein [Streptomyces albireticuli]PAU45461.1 hypothetical protein CK936_29200 [Streptomyces albireticuli]
MKYTIVQIAGAVLLVLGAQGVIRLLIDHDNGGLLGWVPGGFAVRLACYVVAGAAGALLAGWAEGRAKKERGERA